MPGQITPCISHVIYNMFLCVYQYAFVSIKSIEQIYVYKIKKKSNRKNIKERASYKLNC